MCSSRLKTANEYAFCQHDHPPIVVEQTNPCDVPKNYSISVMFPSFESANVCLSSQGNGSQVIQKEEEIVSHLNISARVNGISNFALEAVSEQHLLLAARDGDQAAYGEICKRNSKKILRITLRITRNYEDAEDALQECFLKAMIHIRDFDGRSQFSTWLTRIAINAALMNIRRKQRYREAAIQTTAEFCEGQELIELI